MKKRLKISLFLKISIIIIISLIVTNLFTIIMATQVTEKLFVDSFTILNGKMMDQIAKNFNDYTSQVISVINTYRQNPALKECFTQNIQDQKRLFKLFYNIKSNLKTIDQTSKFPTFHIVSVGINGTAFVSTQERLNYTSVELMNHPIAQKSVANPNKLFFAFSNSGLTASLYNKNVIMAVKQLKDPYSSTNFGTIYVSIDENDFFSMYEGTVSEGNRILVMSSDGTIISSNVKEIVGKQNSKILNYAIQNVRTQNRYISADYDGKPSVLIARYLPIYDVYIVNVVDKSFLLKDFLKLQPLMFMGCFVVICTIVPLVFFITRRITHPLTALVKHMKKSKAGNFRPLLDIQGSYEVRELQQVYNLMVDKIEIYVNNLVEEQKKRRKSEIHALQMQINPHFLYNTLASIKYLSWQGNKEAVTETINALIRLLQNTISKTDEEITVREELLNLQSYVTINHARYGNSIDVAYHFDEDCMDCKIPKLIIQPFIENAFFHAYQQKHSGCIRIFMRIKDEKLICEVIDDGDGISSETYDALTNEGVSKYHFSGIGIRNVDERLKMIYGDGYGIKLTSKVDVGTSVTITMKQKTIN